MRKISYIFLAILLGISYGRAQKPIPSSFTLNGKVIKTEANVQSVKQTYLKSANKSKQANYFIVQFEQLPDIKTQQSIESKGIELLQYISNNAYYALVAPSFYSSKAGSEKLRSIITIKPEYKTDAALANGRIPEYAKEKGGQFKVVITFFEKSNIEQINADLKALNLKTFKIMPSFRQVSATVTDANVSKIVNYNWVQHIEFTAAPKKVNNNDGRNQHKANVLNNKTLGLGYGLSGKGINIGLWDADVEQHRDFGDRAIVHEFEDHHFSSHGTHVFGTIAGAGIIDPRALGMAPEAVLHTWNFNFQSNGLSTQEEREISIKNDNIMITSNSWGYSVSSCPNPFSYNYEDRNEDILTNKYPYFLYVFAAGNDQRSCPDGYRTTSNNQKNSLMVAANDKNNEMSNFSSFGPSYDGRLIPNISGDGVGVYSSTYNNQYGLLSGTSMATPGVAGTMALLFQRYQETNGGAMPWSSFMRGLACNTANDFGHPGPDYKFGYGIINGLRAIEVMEKKQYFLDSVGQGNAISKNITVPAGAVGLKVMLSWTDLEGTPGASKILVNDLDLKLVKNTTTTLPWILNPAMPDSNAKRGIDTLNNLEQITIDNPASGVYTITVNGSAIPKGMQHFAVSYDIIMPQLKLTYPIGGENLNPGTKEIIRWEAYGYSKPFTIEYSIDNGVNYTVIASNIPADARAFSWTVPFGSVSNAKFRVSTGSVLATTMGSFSVQATPENLGIPSGKCGVSAYQLSWDSVSNATYKVYKLNGQTYEFIGNTVTNGYALSGLNPSNDNYFCVRSIDKTTGAMSERSIAVMVNLPANVSVMPFSENFNDQKAKNFELSSKNGSATVSFMSFSDAHGILLQGPTEPVDSTWNSTASSPSEAYSKNPEYLSSAKICNINASSFAGKKMILQFAYRQKYRTAAGTSYFRVKANGNIVKNTDSVDTYGADINNDYKLAFYDLSAYAGNSNVSLEFEGVFETNYNDGVEFYNLPNDMGDFAAIDNIKLYELIPDVSLNNVRVLGGNTSTDTVQIVVQNLSPNAITNIPVTYKRNGQSAELDTIKTSIPSLSQLTFSFKQRIDLSVDGIDTLITSVNFIADSNKSNNSRTTLIYIDKTSIKIGSSSLVTACSGLFTDAGGKYQGYNPNDAFSTTIKPTGINKNSRVTFTEFETEESFDYLIVYDGPDNTYPLIGEFTGYSLPPEITSSAAGGELTFEFYSDFGIEYSGWKANISCVDKPNTNMAAFNGMRMAAAQDSSVIMMDVINLGVQAINTYQINYQVNNNTPVQQTINTRLGPDTAAMHTFNTKAYLPLATKYVIKYWVSAIGDADRSNDTGSFDYSNYFDAEIAINDIVPYRLNNSEISGIISKIGDNNIDSITVAYKINNGAAISQKIAWPSGESYVDFYFGDVNLTAPNQYNISVYSSVASDFDKNNDTIKVNILKPVNSSTNVVASFNNGEAMVVVPPLPTTGMRNNFTVECMTKLNRETFFGRIIEKGTFRLYYAIDETVYPENTFVLNADNGAGGFIYFYPGTVKPNSWQHLSISVSGNVYKFYIDGVEQTPEVYSGQAGSPNPNAGQYLFIGNRGNLNRPVDGYIDEFRLWNTVLTQTQIQNRMHTNINVGIADSNLVAYYKFIEGAGDFVYDYSSNDNTAFIMNADVDGMGEGKFWNTPGILMEDFKIPGQQYPTTFNSNTNTFNVIMRNANLSNLTAQYSAIAGSTVKIGSVTQSSGVTSNNFTSPITYTLNGVGFNLGINQTYTAIVTNEILKDSACTLTAFWFDPTENPGKPQINMVKNGSNFDKKMMGLDASAMRAKFTIPATAKLYLDDVIQTNPQATVANYTKPVMVKVVAEDGKNMNMYAINLDVRSNVATLSSFGLPITQIGLTKTDTIAKTIQVIVKPNTNLAMQTPSFTKALNANVYVNGIAQFSGISSNNYNSPVAYKVVSEDETVMVDWMVTVSKQVMVSSITLSGAGGSTTITTKGGTLQITAAILPNNASFKDVTWSIVNGTGVGSISSTGLLTASKDGTVTVKAKANDSSNVEGTLLITISNQTVGLNQNLTSPIKVYPNPTTNNLFVENPNGDNLTLVVFDLLGSKILEKSTHELMNTLDISSLKNGLYFIQISNAKNESTTIKIIKE